MRVLPPGQVGAQRALGFRTLGVGIVQGNAELVRPSALHVEWDVAVDLTGRLPAPSPPIVHESLSNLLPSVDGWWNNSIRVTRKHQVCIEKHQTRALDIAGVPSESLVEGCCTEKHSLHVSDVAGVPREWLVEGDGTAEHRHHVLDLACIPSEWLVEGGCKVKHLSHVSDVARVPREGLVE